MKFKFEEKKVFTVKEDELTLLNIEYGEYGFDIVPDRVFPDKHLILEVLLTIKETPKYLDDVEFKKNIDMLTDGLESLIEDGFVFENLDHNENDFNFVSNEDLKDILRNLENGVPYGNIIAVQDFINITRDKTVLGEEYTKILDEVKNKTVTINDLKNRKESRQTD